MSKVTPKAVAKTLNKADFFTLKTVVQTLDIKELGGSVGIKSMTASEREGLERKMQSELDNNGIRATVFIYSVCDLEGNLLFTEEDLDSIKGLPSSVVSKVFDVSNKLNGLSPDAVEEAVKN